MKNKLLVATLGICTAVCTIIADYAYTGQVFDERAAEIARYESLNADPHMLYCGYTVEELGKGYTKPSSVFGKVLLDVPVINQYPELPIGCEITSAAAVLQYLGFDVDKLYLTDNYLEWDDNFTYDDEMVSHGPDPRKVFAGTHTTGDTAVSRLLYKSPLINILRTTPLSTKLFCPRTSTPPTLKSLSTRECR